MKKVDIEVGHPLTGKFGAELVDESGVLPKNVIRVTDAFEINCMWYIQGGLASSLGGKWYVQAAFESIGPGPEFRSDEFPVELTGVTGEDNAYKLTIEFPAGLQFPDGTPKVPEGARNEPYMVTVLLAYTDMQGKPGPLAACADLGELTIYA